MQFDIIALFPGIIEPSLKEGVLRRACEQGIVTVRLHALRDYADDPHRRVDDYPYGGGAGMVLKPEPIFAAVEDVERRFPSERGRRVLLGPQGALLNHDEAVRLSLYERVILICGRYEGVDARVRDHLADEELSVGDYVLSGGELPAAVVVDAVARLVPGVVGNAESVLGDTFAEGLLGAPQYTRPAEFRGMKVPEVLVSGDHARVEAWRREMAIRNTGRRRPDLMGAGAAEGAAAAGRGSDSGSKSGGAGEQ
jgi:tRNA (guanine37-N1)-methyltransferase